MQTATQLVQISLCFDNLFMAPCAPRELTRRQTGDGMNPQSQLMGVTAKTYRVRSPRRRSLGACVE
jgi:hypothetical protein